VSSNPFKTLRRHRDFRRLWLSAVISDLGTWMQAVTVTVLVAKASRSSGATALVFSSLFIPQALISPIGGLVADRFDRRKVAMTMQWIQAVLAALLALVIHNGVTSTLPLTMIVLVQGIASALSNPAYGAMIPLLVPREELLGALSLSGMTWNTGRAIGPALAALTITVWGPAASIAGNAVSFALMGLVLLTIKRPLHGGGHVSLRQFRSEITQSARAAWSSTTTRTMMLSTSVLQLFVSVLFSTVATYSGLVDHWERLPMALFAAMGTGALIGAFSVAALTARIGRSRVLTLFPTMAGAAILLAAVAHSALAALIALFIFGMFGPVSFISFGAVVQRDAPEQNRGRILSIYSAGVGFSFGAFSIGGGFIADHALGLRHTMLVCSIGLWASLLAVRLFWKDWCRIINGRDAAPKWRPASLPRFSDPQR
jgi:MFS family permease